MRSNVTRGKLTRAIIVVAAIAAIVAILACGPGTLLSRNEPTATPTKTPKPTFTITPTPTITPIPTDTPTPTSTATPTPLPTNTPVVYTATPTPIPSDTPTPIPTNTPPPPPTATRRPQPQPTRAPTQPPPPTNTPAPSFPWNGVVSNTFHNCGLTRLFGHTLDRNGGLAGGVWVRYWADGWEGAWAESSWNDRGAFAGDEHNWDGTLKSFPEQGLWHVCVVDSQGSKNCLSNIVDAATGYDCNTDWQIVHITFKQN